jgi:hypothetical protein
MLDASRRFWLVFSLCLATAGNALGQRPGESPEAEGLLTIERYLGTVGTGLLVIGVAVLSGGAIIGRALWIIRPVFRGDDFWYKVGVVFLLGGGVLVLVVGVAMGVEIARGKSLSRWLAE